MGVGVVELGGMSGVGRAVWFGGGEARIGGSRPAESPTGQVARAWLRGLGERPGGEDSVAWGFVNDLWVASGGGMRSGLKG